MNARLHTLIADAESRLAAGDQERLAALVEAFVSTHEAPDDFSPEERAHLSMIDAEPFDSADPAEVAAFFAKRG
jgi:hypothetical protein